MTTPHPPRPLALEARGIHKAFDGVRVLEGVDFLLREGEVHALVGANGAGKSTLMKILNGLYLRDAGTLTVFGEPAAYTTPEGARAAGLAMVYQDLSLVGTLTVAENIFLQTNPYQVGPFIDDGRARDEAVRLLGLIGVDGDLDPDAKVADISVGDQQVVEIAKALSGNPRVLILDEPTASLSSSEIEVLFQVVGRLKDRGISVIYITHYLRDIFRICDRATVLRDGKTVLAKPVDETSVDELVTAMVGEDRDFGAQWSKKDRSAWAAPLLSVRGLTTERVRDVTFEIRPGEIVGVAGLLGSGRTELLKALYGCDRILAGSLDLAGTEVDPRSPTEALAAGIALVPEDRRKQGLVLDFSIEENIILPILHKVRGGLLVSRSKAGKLATHYIRHLGVKATGKDQKVRFLSGGNQQKVVVAKCLSSEARVLLLDDPTFGVDLNAKHEIMQIVKNFASEGRGVVFVSSEFKEMVEFCDVIYVMKKGRITDLIEEAVTEEQLMQMVQ